jgi:hypothetical protein
MSRRRLKIWFWVASVANLAVCAFTLLLIYAYLLLMGIAAGIVAWPYYVALISGFLLSIVAWVLSGKLVGKTKLIGRLLNGAAFLIYAGIVVVGVSMWFHATRRLFLVPARFQGDLYVVHDRWHGTSGTKGFLRVKYTFPSDGFLVVSDPDPMFFNDKYQYIYPDGTVQTIHDAGPGTLQDTPENRQNTKEIVTYFGRTSKYGDHEECPVEEISIGTRAFLLARQSEGPPPIETHPGLCKH